MSRWTGKEIRTRGSSDLLWISLQKRFVATCVQNYSTSRSQTPGLTVLTLREGGDTDNDKKRFFCARGPTNTHAYVMVSTFRALTQNQQINEFKAKNPWNQLKSLVFKFPSSSSSFSSSFFFLHLLHDAFELSMCSQLLTDTAPPSPLFHQSSFFPIIH